MIMEAYVDVHLKLNLQEYKPNQGKQFTYKMLKAATVHDLTNELNLPDEESLLIIINGVQASLETNLQKGDQVTLFPLIAGG